MVNISGWVPATSKERLIWSNQFKYVNLFYLNLSDSLHKQNYEFH